jgi:hypothetical protein
VVVVAILDWHFLTFGAAKTYFGFFRKQREERGTNIKKRRVKKCGLTLSFPVFFPSLTAKKK